MSLTCNNAQELHASLQELQQRHQTQKSLAFDIVTDATALSTTYSRDRSYYRSGVPPAVAVLPHSPEAVALLVKHLRKHRVAIIARGAGTGLEGGCVPHLKTPMNISRNNKVSSPSSLVPLVAVVDTERLQRVAPSVRNGYCWVGAGVTKLQLNKHLSGHGVMFAPDPASNPSIGGMVSTSGSGMSTFKYGTTRDNVVALKVVTAEGNVLVTRAAVRKSSTGLDLTNLYCGSEGTLGVVCEVCVKLHRAPKFRVAGIATFANVSDAVASVVDMKQNCAFESLVRCELLNAGGVAASNRHFGTRLQEVPTVLLEFQHSSAIPATTTTTQQSSDEIRWEENEERSYALMKSEFEQFKLIFSKHRATQVRYYNTAKEIDDIWEARRGCLLAAMKYRFGSAQPSDLILNTDVCVPILELTRAVTETEEDFAKHKTPCVICAHIADGNYHSMIPFRTDEERATAYKLEGNLVRRALAVGGTVSGEHGVGVGKKRHLLHEHGDVHVDIQRRIKTAMDPLDLMNPGKFYPESDGASKL